MKTLIEKTIKVRGIGNPQRKNIFTIENEFETRLPDYYNIEKICGRTLRVDYSFNNDQGAVQFAFIQLVIPFGLTELEVKDFIVEEITTAINN
jgi:hypothetical protein